MAKVYVSTYAKYNAGSLKGQWLDLSDYADHAEFEAACRELHSDEADAELMFQDFEEMPAGFYSESSINPAVWEWLELSDEERELVAAYQYGVDAAGTIEQAREAFAGTADTERDFAEEWYESTDSLAGVPDHLRHYIDFDAIARDMRLSGDITFVRYEGTLYAFHAI